MSNSLWFSRIFTLQSFSWFCFNYSFWSFLGVFEKKYYESERFFYNHWIWKFSKFSFFSFPFLKSTHFKITTNSFIYSLVEQFLETHFHKKKVTGLGGILLKKLTKIFGFIYPLPGFGRILYEQKSSPLFVYLKLLGT